MPEVGADVKCAVCRRPALRYFAAAQFGPDATETSSGTAISATTPIASFAIAVSASTSPVGRLEHQLVVDLKHHAASEALGTQAPVHLDHRELHDVGGGPLHRVVHRRPLSERAQVVVAAS